MCVPRPARSLANLPRAASRLRPHAGVDASSSVPAAPILGQSRPGFGRRDLDPLDRRRGRDAADHAAFRGSPALAPRLRAPRIPTRRQPRASRGAPLARNISPPPEPRSTVPSPSRSPLTLPPPSPPAGPTTKTRSITGPTSRRRASPSAPSSSPRTTRASPAWRRTPPARRTARGSTSTCGGASTSAWRPTSSRTPSERGGTRRKHRVVMRRGRVYRRTNRADRAPEPRRRLVDLSYPRGAGPTPASHASRRAFSFAVTVPRTVSPRPRRCLPTHLSRTIPPRTMWGDRPPEERRGASASSPRPFPSRARRRLASRRRRPPRRRRVERPPRGSNPPPPHRVRRRL